MHICISVWGEPILHSALFQQKTKKPQADTQTRRMYFECVLSLISWVSYFSRFSAPARILISLMICWFRLARLFCSLLRPVWANGLHPWDETQEHSCQQRVATSYNVVRERDTKHKGHLGKLYCENKNEAGYPPTFPPPSFLHFNQVMLWMTGSRWDYDLLNKSLFFYYSGESTIC